MEHGDGMRARLRRFSTNTSPAVYTHTSFKAGHNPDFQPHPTTLTHPLLRRRYIHKNQLDCQSYMRPDCETTTQTQRMLNTYETDKVSFALLLLLCSSFVLREGRGDLARPRTPAAHICVGRSRACAPHPAGAIASFARQLCNAPGACNLTSSLGRRLQAHADLNYVHIPAMSPAAPGQFFHPDVRLSEAALERSARAWETTAARDRVAEMRATRAGALRPHSAHAALGGGRKEGAPAAAPPAQRSATLAPQGAAAADVKPRPASASRLAAAAAAPPPPMQPAAARTGSFSFAPVAPPPQQQQQQQQQRPSRPASASALAGGQAEARAAGAAGTLHPELKPAIGQRLTWAQGAVGPGAKDMLKTMVGEAAAWPRPKLVAQPQDTILQRVAWSAA